MIELALLIRFATPESGAGFERHAQAAAGVFRRQNHACSFTDTTPAPDLESQSSAEPLRGHTSGSALRKW